MEGYQANRGTALPPSCSQIEMTSISMALEAAAKCNGVEPLQAQLAHVFSLIQGNRIEKWVRGNSAQD
eukprot:scaffold293892_cov19-Tisochrysis_lutea.AAC.1